MLYDNAQLLRVYLHLWRVTGSPLAERVSRQTADFLLRDLGTVGGGFASSLDADSEGVEGLPTSGRLNSSSRSSAPTTAAAPPLCWRSPSPGPSNTVCQPSSCAGTRTTCGGGRALAAPCWPLAACGHSRRETTRWSPAGMAWPSLR